MQLTELKRGQVACLRSLTARDDLRRRLQDMGLIEGTPIECVGRSPLGDPCAYLIRGAVVALRDRDAGGILVGEPSPVE